MRSQKLLIAMITIFLSSNTMAIMPKELPGDIKRTNVKYFSVEMFQVAPEYEDRIQQILAEYMYPAAKKSGFEYPIIFKMSTGSYNYLSLFPMPRGAKQIEFIQTIEQNKFMKALIEIAGSQEQAENIIKEYQSILKNFKRDLGFVDSIYTYNVFK